MRQTRCYYSPGVARFFGVFSASLISGLLYLPLDKYLPTLIKLQKSVILSDNLNHFLPIYICLIIGIIFYIIGRSIGANFRITNELKACRLDITWHYFFISFSSWVILSLIGLGWSLNIPELNNFLKINLINFVLSAMFFGAVAGLVVIRVFFLIDQKFMNTKPKLASFLNLVTPIVIVSIFGLVHFISFDLNAIIGCLVGIISIVITAFCSDHFWRQDALKRGNDNPRFY